MINSTNRKAEMGVGTLIIFIAMLFVTAVAAGVLIQTGNSLQSKALSTAKSSERAVSTWVMIFQIEGSDGSSGMLRNFEAQAKLSPGSDGVSLTDSLLELQLNNASVDLVYSNESCTNVSSSAGDGYYTNAITNNGTFTVEYIHVTAQHSDGILFRGEIVKLCFASPRDIDEDEEVEVRFTSQVGNSKTVQFITPEVITQQIVQVFP